MSHERQPGFEFQILETADGSPSLRLWKKNQAPEAMHHLAGAFSETLYIYDSALREAHQQSGQLQVLSVGLGLGYNEILTAARAFQWSCDLVMESFESETELRQNFLNWLHGVHSFEPFSGTYDKILNLVAGEVELMPLQVKDHLKELEAAGRWNLRGTLALDTRFDRHFNCVLFDAFSGGATPELWTEDFLDTLLMSCAAPQCVFSTYAATGNLRRSLAQHGFSVELRPGFAGKRQSTWAIKTTLLPK